MGNRMHSQGRHVSGSGSRRTIEAGHAICPAQGPARAQAIHSTQSSLLEYWPNRRKCMMHGFHCLWRTVVTQAVMCVTLSSPCRAKSLPSTSALAASSHQKP